MTNQQADNYCSGCKFLKLIYELDDRQYYFGCESKITCDKIKEKELDKDDRSTSDTLY